MTAEVTATVTYVSNTETMENPFPLSASPNTTITYTEIHVDNSNNVILSIEHTNKLGVQL